MFDIEQFIAECRTAAGESEARKAVGEIVTRAVADASGVTGAFGEPQRAGIDKVYNGPDLTILHLLWGPHMTIRPHDHNMWAVIGIYTGAEDNVFWRRDEERLRASGARALRNGDVAVLGNDVIHSVTNPIEKLTGAIHVYGGDFFAAERKEWDPQTLAEQDYDVERTVRLFEESNSRFTDGA